GPAGISAARICQAAALSTAAEAAVSDKLQDKESSAPRLRCGALLYSVPLPSSTVMQIDANC
ncbi:MAG: hypothetical protein ACI4EP_07930, partial [Suilimivivens sp.]